MVKYFSSYFISNKMLNDVSAIMEKLGKLGNYEDLSKLPMLQNDSIIKIIQSSLALENIQFTIEDVKSIISDTFSGDDEKNIEKVKKLYSLYCSEETLNSCEILDMKKINKILNNSDNFRKTNGMQMIGTRCFILAPSPAAIESLCEELVGFVSVNKIEIHPLILSVIFHYMFVYINPFENDNALIARICQNSMLAKWRKIFNYVPVEAKILENKVQYKSIIDKCNQKGTFNEFVEFMLKMIDESLEDLLNEVKNQINPVSTSVSKLLSIMEPNVPISANEIMERLNIKSKETLRGTYLKPAMQSGLVVALLPDKPTSKKQMYYKV